MMHAETRPTRQGTEREMQKTTATKKTQNNARNEEGETGRSKHNQTSPIQATNFLSPSLSPQTTRTLCLY